MARVWKQYTRGGEQRHQLYTSPSVRHAEHPIYTIPHMCDGRKAIVVLQCRQQLGYEVCGETIGSETLNLGVAISRQFPNNAVERLTRARGSVSSHDVLVKLKRSHIIVDWLGHSLSRTSVCTTQILKCAPGYFFAVGDIVNAAFNLDYNILPGDQEGRRVKKGVLGTIIAIPSFGQLTMNWSGRDMGETWLKKNR